MAIQELYEMLTSLDKGCARSKKSRAEYVRFKFGGDIRTGALIMLEAISDELPRCEGSDAYEAYIQKASYIRGVLNYLSDNADRLDLLPSLSDPKQTEGTQIIIPFTSIGNQPTMYPQRELYSLTKGNAVHYCCDADGFQYTPLALCDVIKVFNSSMANAVDKGYTVLSVKANSNLFRVNPGNIVEGVTPAEVAKLFKSK